MSYSEETGVRSGYTNPFSGDEKQSNGTANGHAVDINGKHNHVLINAHNSDFRNNLTTSNYNRKRHTSSWKVYASDTACNTCNPIRAIVDGMDITANPDKKMIALSLGDPTVFHNFEPHQTMIDSVVDAVKSGKYNGYGPSYGRTEAREAVAKYVGTAEAPVTGEDVFLTCGCSDAIGLAITVLADPGDNILVPRPGFSLYKTLSHSQGIEVRHYDLLPKRSWEVDLEHMESLIDAKTKVIVVVNPSNPCGSNFSLEHIRAIIDVAERNKVPIMADEIYADIVFSGQTFTSCASQSTAVPVLSCGGIAKRFLVPGWRLGWVVMHDRNNVFGKDIRNGLVKLTQRILGPTTFIQAALPSMLTIPQSFHDDVIAKIEKTAKYMYEKLSVIPGLRPVKPQAAMYMMVGFDRKHFPEFPDDKVFTEKLVSEQSVFCLPAQCFAYPNYIRLVLTLPEDQSKEACTRIEEFCREHYKH